MEEKRKKILSNHYEAIRKGSVSGALLLLKRKEKKLKYFEGVHRSVWTLRCVSYEMYQLFAATVLLYPENVSKICSSDKEYMNSGERGKSPFQLKGSWV